MNNQPKYSVFGNVSDVEKVSTFNHVSGWKNAEITFNWANFDYPYYHTHEYWEAFVLVEGELVHHIGNRQIKMKKGDAWLIRPSDNHKLSAPKGTQIKTLAFALKTEYAEKLFELYGVDLNDAEKYPDTSFTVSERLLRTIVNETILIQSQKNSLLFEKILRCKVLFDSFFGEFLAQKVMPSQNVPDWLEKLLIKISDPNFSEYAVKTELAAQTNYSYSSMIRLFKQYTGYTIVEYIQIKKVEYAMEILTHSDKQITEICGILGYDSLSYFNRMFKRHTGTTPLRFRKSAQN